MSVTKATLIILYKIIIIIINSFYRAQITVKSLSAFRTRIDRHMYLRTHKNMKRKNIKLKSTSLNIIVYITMEITLQTSEISIRT